MIKTLKNHPSNLDTKIWRYIDLPKYLSLLKTRSLYFARSDFLGDRFEGSFPQINIKERERFFSALFPTSDRSRYKDYIERFFLSSTNLHRLIIPRVYINCWHVNSYESQAMWELYSQSSKGIAIQSTYRRLRDCLPASIDIGLVKYISYSKYSKDTIPEDNPIAPFFYKRKSYEHEKELRAIYYMDFNNDELKDLNLLSNIPEDYFEQQKAGHYFQINLDELIEKIYVYPFIEAWFLEAISDLTEKYGLSSKIIRHSTLEKTPLY